jgi:hypothetical protein
MMSTITTHTLSTSIASHVLWILLSSLYVGDAKFTRGERLWACNAPATPQRLRLLFLVNRSTQRAEKGNGQNFHHFACRISNASASSLGLLYEQVPKHECCTEYTRRPEYRLGCAPSFRGPLEFLVTASNILRCRERILH